MYLFPCPSVCVRKRLNATLLLFLWPIGVSFPHVPNSNAVVQSPLCVNSNRIGSESSPHDSIFILHPLQWGCYLLSGGMQAARSGGADARLFTCKATWGKGLSYHCHAMLTPQEGTRDAKMMSEERGTVKRERRREDEPRGKHLHLHDNSNSLDSDHTCASNHDKSPLIFVCLLLFGFSLKGFLL